MQSVAVVVLDTLRKDAFDRHFDWLPGRRYERAYSTADWTVPAHASLFTGRYPSEVGVHAKHLQFDCETPAIAEGLREAGYATRAFSANTNITGHMGFDRGFTDFRVPPAYESLNDDETFDWRSFNRSTRHTGLRKYLAGGYECLRSDGPTIQSLVAGARLAMAGDEAVAYGGAEEAMAEVESMDFGDREFLFLNLMETHEPFVAPESYATVGEPPLTDSVGDLSMEPVDGEHVRAAYDDCARYLSDVYRELFAGLRETFDYVVTVSDHGEMLGEHGAWGHEYGLYPELTHVPLSVAGEGFDGEPPCSAPVSILDVHATVADLAGLDVESRGRSLVGAVDDHDGATDGRDGAIDGPEYLTEYRGLTVWSERKLERNGFESEIGRYDAPLRGYVGPGDCYAYETPDGLEATGDDGPTDPRARLEAIVDDLDVRRVDGRGSVPEEIRDQLERLGYA